ncbi:MAG TPA: LuxR C-terminal-related transcriptional regulator [Streptosporangiaceae bacterium]|jgi:predicted ATPase/DNA-binding CsgD family transcriptional regulator
MATPARRPGNLPAETTSFVGRRRELAEVRKKLTGARLVSLAGPGGVGKTRLAIRLAADLRRGFRDGGWLVELAEVLDPALVSSAVLAALDLHDQAASEPLPMLLSYLRDRELLLVVDNCEHLLAAAGGVVTDILRAAPGVRVIATSREPLSVPGEHVVPVPPLELPSPGASQPVAALAQNEAVGLFTQRAAAASGTFELTAANQAAVVSLCRRLDGLPLAIELAAVRTRVLTVEQILGRLTDRFGLLTGGSRAALPRHQTLRTTIEWSHDLLTGPERAVLRRCCAFAGRFTLEDVEAVGSSQDVPAAQALDVLASLVDKSLVMKEDVGGLACYRLHETMREFARLELAAAGEAEAVELRCAGYYRDRCRRSARDRRYQLLEWLAWADLEIDNLRAVLQRCLSRGDVAAGLELSASLGWYWITRATTEGMRWLGQFLAAGGGDSRLRAWALFLHGFLGVLKADPAAAVPGLQAAVAAARQTGQRGLLVEALAMASIAQDMAGDRAAARRLLAEAQHEESPGYRPGLAAVLQARAFHGFFTGDLGEVRSAASQAAELARAAGDLYTLENMLLNLGSAALAAGDAEAAKPLITEALQLAGQIDDRVAQLYLLDAAGCHAALSGRPRLAARLLGGADAARREAGANFMPFLLPLLSKARASAVAALGAAAFQAEFAAGQQLGREAALALALGKHAHRRAGAAGAGGGGSAAAAAGAAAGPAGAGLLGKREAEVAHLVADGLTNKQIGARLFISERTVDSHVRSILNKLGFSSRAQIAAWQAASGELPRQRTARPPPAHAGGHHPAWVSP